ncbi:MAG: hypothetical protein PHR16_16370 [Methylovulum sp.]|nr:hypothetical protein [Methylovulum sp.]
MSHYSDFDLVVLDKTEIPAYFGEKVAAILLGKEASTLPQNTETANTLQRRMRGSTRSDSFKWRMAELLKLASIESLRFIAETACTHLVLSKEYGAIIEDATYMETEEKEEDKEDDQFAAHQYTVIKPEKCDAVIADLKKLFSWCSDNVSPASDILEFDDEDVKNAIANAVVCEDLNKQADYGEDGDSAEFFFCALKSILELLKYAKANNLYAVYKNENYPGMYCLKKYMPHIIVD